MERTQGRSAPYGRACYSCFKTKCKCVPRLEGDECERCFRLQRPCYPADSLRRRSEKKPNSSDARISKVENTLSQLVRLLQGGEGSRFDERLQQQQPLPQQQPSRQHHLPPRPNDVETVDCQSSGALMMTPPSLQQQDFSTPRLGEDRSLPDSNPSPTAEDAVLGQDINDASASVSSAPTRQVTADSSGHGSGYDTNMVVSPADSFLPHRTSSSPASSIPPQPTTNGVTTAFSSTESASLDTFRTRMLQHFPIVHLPADCTAQQLQHDRPFLFRAIVCVTTRSSEARRARALELKRVMCEQAFLKQATEAARTAKKAQTVDLLLGLLVYLGWGWDHLCSSSRCDDVPRLMSLAISLVGELRPRDGSATAEPARTIRLLEPSALDTTETARTTAETPYARLERHRAILGCFILGSAVAAYYDQIDAPRWTPEMDAGLADLSRSDAVMYPSDAILDLQVRLELLGTRATQIRDRAQVPGQPPATTLPPAALSQIRSLMGELQFMRTSIPVELQQHFGLLAHTYYTEFCIIKTIHDIPNEPSPSPPNLPSLRPPSTAPKTIDCGPSRLSCFWQSALAIRSFTSTCMTLSPCADMRGISFAQWAQFSHCLAALHQLDTLREPGWGPGALRRLVDVPELLAGAVEALEKTAAAEAAAEAAEVAERCQSSLTPSSSLLHSSLSPSAALPSPSSDNAFLKLARGLSKFQSTYHAKETQPKTVYHDLTDDTTLAASGSAPEAPERLPEVPPTGAPLEGLADGLPPAGGADGQSGYDLSITSWFDQFLVNFDEQSVTAF